MRASSHALTGFSSLALLPNGPRRQNPESAQVARDAGKRDPQRPPMNDLLALLAEISVGFTGFAAMVSALGNAPSEADARLDRLRLRNLVEMGVIIVSMATLPLVLMHGETGTEWEWTVSAVLLSITLVALVFVHGGRNRAARVSELEGYSLFSALALWTLGIGSLGMLVVAFAVPQVIRLEVAYVAALWLMTVMLGVYFIRIAGSLLTHRIDGHS